MYARVHDESSYSKIYLQTVDEKFISLIKQLHVTLRVTIVFGRSKFQIQTLFRLNIIRKYVLFIKHLKYAPLRINVSNKSERFITTMKKIHIHYHSVSSKYLHILWQSD